MNGNKISPIIIPVVLCGGSGTRLWPLSRKSFPKQFVPLFGDKSLLTLTLERVKDFSDHTLIVASNAHRYMIQDIMITGQFHGTVILEPEGRNTSAAIALAALCVEKYEIACKKGHNDALLLFCPADHHIPNIADFYDTVYQGLLAAKAGSIVTFGVQPSIPSTAYGYIHQGEGRSDGSYQVERFTEKPNASKAAELLLSGNVFWNTGIFLSSVNSMIQALEKHAPDILAACQQAMLKADNEPTAYHFGFVHPDANSFALCRAQSIDYAVIEPHADVAMVPFIGRWSDVGSWNAVAELISEPDDAGNRTLGHGFAHLANNTFVYAPHRPAVALGTQNLLIIDTPDALLVAHQDYAEEVKNAVAHLEETGYQQAVIHRKVSRPWGWYDSIDMGDRFQVKRISVRPGASLSLQKHHHRAEHRVVVKGTAEVTRGDSTFLLTENQSTYIPIGVVHRLKNPGIVELEIIEIQSGTYLAEDDILRLEDVYGRVPA